MILKFSSGKQIKINGNFKNLIGKTFNFLYVKNLHSRRLKKDGKNYYYWLCQCICGKEKIASSNDLKGGDVQSCGCKRIASNRLNFGEAAFNELFSRYKKRATRKKLKFEITREEFRIFIQKSCYFCNFSPTSKMKHPEKFGFIIYNGIDRLDNKKGYIKDNIIPCCGFCNRAKFTHTKEEFLNWLENIRNGSRNNKISEPTIKNSF
jgi:hypothetical protein